MCPNHCRSKLYIIHDQRLQYDPKDRKKRNIVLNKNIATGSAILEISKKLMLEFSYNMFKRQWPGIEQVQVFYGDTDSLLLKVKTIICYSIWKMESTLALGWIIQTGKSSSIRNW